MIHAWSFFQCGSYRANFISQESYPAIHSVIVALDSQIMSVSKPFVAERGLSNNTHICHIGVMSNRNDLSCIGILPVFLLCHDSFILPCAVMRDYSAHLICMCECCWSIQVSNQMCPRSYYTLKSLCSISLYDQLLLVYLTQVKRSWRGNDPQIAQVILVYLNNLRLR